MSAFRLHRALLAGAALAALAVAAHAQSAHAQTAQTSTAPAANGAASPGRSPFTGEVAFGDSLSDAGNIAAAEGSPTPKRYTTNPGLTTVEYVGAAYGLPVTASLTGGTDFAYGGAGVTTNSPGTPSSVPTETAQIDGYLLAHPALDGRTLYTVFAGANDIFSAETSVVANGIAQGLIASAVAGQSPAQAAVTAANVNALVAGIAGVPSLYGFDRATQVISAAGTTEGQLVGRLQGAGARAVLVFNLPDIGLTPSAASEGTAAAAQLTQLSQTYNAALNSEIAAHPRGVIPVDTFDLFRETLSNPAAYGYVNSTVPACTTSSSFDCTPATLRAPDAAATYVFADGVHPTTQTHELFAQAVLSEITAPSYISLLPEAPLAVSDGARDVWGRELEIDSTDPDARSRAFVRVDYDSQSLRGGPYSVGADSDGGVLTLGFDWRPSTTASLGLALTGGRTFASFDDRAAKFRADTVLLTGFGQWTVLGHGYVNASAGVGALDYDDIERTFALGPAARQERGYTDGLLATGVVTAGWWFGGPTLRFGPYLQGQYAHVHVGGYDEEAGDALSMTFGPQSREQVVGEMGLKADGRLRTRFGELAPFASVAYDHDGRADVRSVDAGLVLMPGVFTLPGYEPAADWGAVRAGLDWRFAPGWTAEASYSGRFADGGENLNIGSLALKRSF